MGARNTVLAVGAVLAAVAVAGCGGGGREEGPSSGVRPSQADVEFDLSGWRTDFAKHNVALDEFRSGGPGRDGIPPIDEPKPVSQKQAEGFLDDREPVLVVERGGAVRAYPVQILIWHEIVNDELGGRQIAVTYCPLCNSSVVFDRRVGGRTLSFGTTGNLRKSDLVMWDRQTESWWQQLSAEAIVGTLTGTKLDVLPSQTLSWASFKARYPRGDVLSRDTGAERDYCRNPYAGYDKRDSEPFLLNGDSDDRLPPKERVAAVFAGGEVAVFPFSRLAREPVVNDEVGGKKVVVLYAPGVTSALDAASISASKDVGTAAAFERRVGGRTLQLRRRRGGADDRGRYVDKQTGSTWDITGTAISGPLRGRRLKPVRNDQQFWFALAAFVPEAKIRR
ncbi:MAG: DUF3179 domain-containing protein [Thermoleophilaceae bacterium]|nr:DUF3179 domain-containing protein [Thermoleophilaceae bacterium]